MSLKFKRLVSSLGYYTSQNDIEIIRKSLMELSGDIKIQITVEFKLLQVPLRLLRLSKITSGVQMLENQVPLWNCVKIIIVVSRLYFDINYSFNFFIKANSWDLTEPTNRWWHAAMSLFVLQNATRFNNIYIFIETLQYEHRK